MVALLKYCASIWLIKSLILKQPPTCHFILPLRNVSETLLRCCFYKGFPVTENTLAEKLDTADRQNCKVKSYQPSCCAVKAAYVPKKRVKKERGKVTVAMINI